MKEILTVYAIGSIGYRFIEILWRGRTHWTMGVVGGICFICIYCFEYIFKRTPLFIRAFYSAVCITAIELLSGLVINNQLGLAVWDYSGMRFHFMGQICLLYSVLWYFLCIPAHSLCKLIRHRVFDALPKKKRYLTNIFERQSNYYE